MARKSKRAEPEEELPEEPETEETQELDAAEPAEGEAAEETVDVESDAPSGRRGKRDVGGKAARQPSGPSGRKSQATAMLLCAFLGALGADRFYTGRIALGVVKLLCSLVALSMFFVRSEGLSPGFKASTAISLGVVAFVCLLALQLYDLVLIGMGRMSDKYGQPLERGGADKPNPDGLCQGRAFLLSFFAGLIGTDRFYVGSKVFGGVKIGLLVLGLILLIVASPHWVGFHKYEIAYRLDGEVKRKQIEAGNGQSLLTKAAGDAGAQRVEDEDFKALMQWRKMELKDPLPGAEEKLLDVCAAVVDSKVTVIAYPTEADLKACQDANAKYYEDMATVLPLPAREIARQLGLDRVTKKYNLPDAWDSALSSVYPDSTDPERPAAAPAPEGGDGAAAPEEAAAPAGDAAEKPAAVAAVGNPAPLAATLARIDPGTRTETVAELANVDYGGTVEEELLKTRMRMLHGLTGDWGEKSPYQVVAAYINQFPLQSGREGGTLLTVALVLLGAAILLWKIDMLIFGMGGAKDVKGKALSLDPAYAVVHCEECGEQMVVDLRQPNLTHVVCRYEECQGYCPAPDPGVVEEVEKYRDQVLPHTVLALTFGAATVAIASALLATLFPDALGNYLVAPDLEMAQQLLGGGAFVTFCVTFWQLIEAERSRPVCEF